MARRPTRDLEDLMRHATAPLDADAERRYIVAAQAGDRAAMGRLVTSNLPWIAKLAAKVTSQRVAIPLPDAVQEGVIGLMGAVRDFDPGTENRLKTIATRAIFWSIRRANSDYMRIRLDCQWMQPKWAGRRGPGLRERAEIAARCGSETEVAGLTDTSSERIYGGRDDPALAALEAREAAQVTLGSWLPRLKPRDREVVELKHGAGWSFAEIGAQIGVTKQRAAQMEADAMAKLREIAAGSDADQAPNAGYRRLSERLPLRPLGSESEREKAVSVANELTLREHLNEGESAYLEVLVAIIEMYEGAHDPLPDLPPAAMLKHLIKLRGRKPEAVSRATGIAASTLYLMLKGKRSLRRQHIAALAAYFKVGMWVFLGQHGRD
jgi:RNA polymerase sigma factor (sigma-70 family)